MRAFYWLVWHSLSNYISISYPSIERWLNAPLLERHCRLKKQLAIKHNKRLLWQPLSHIDLNRTRGDWSPTAVCNFLDAAAVSWLRCVCVCVLVVLLLLQSWRIEECHIRPLSLRLLTLAISCVKGDPPPLSLSLCRADLSCRGGRVWSNLRCNMSKQVQLNSTEVNVTGQKNDQSKRRGI